MNSRTTKTFWRYFDGLPLDVRRQSVRTYARWRENAMHPGLRFKCVSTKHDAYSVRIGLPLGYRDTVAGEPAMTWFWIGTHADDDNLLASM